MRNLAKLVPLFGFKPLDSATRALPAFIPTFSSPHALRRGALVNTRVWIPSRRTIKTSIMKSVKNKMNHDAREEETESSQEEPVLRVVERLRQQRNELKEEYEEPNILAPTLLKEPITINTTSPNNNTSTQEINSIISNIKLIGIFPSSGWLEDPTYKELFHGRDWIGNYRIVDFDVTDGNGSVMELNAVVNIGDADCNTGFWGAVFERSSSKKVVTIHSFSDATKVREVSSNISSFVPFNSEVLDLPVDEEDLCNGDYYDDDDVGVDYFGENLSPGDCGTQFEKIIGMAMRAFMFYDKGWEALPKQLIDYGKDY